MHFLLLYIVLIVLIIYMCYMNIVFNVAQCLLPVMKCLMY